MYMSIGELHKAGIPSCKACQLIKLHYLLTMQILTLVVLILLAPSVNAKGQHKLDTTPAAGDNTWTLQIEENFYHTPANTNYINATLGYSFDFGLDIQLATYNAPLTGGGAQNYELDNYLNITQSFKLIHNAAFVIGTQNGTVFAQPAQWHNVEFGVFSYTPFKSIEIHGGSYFVNRDLGTIGINVVGYTTGFVTKVAKAFRIEGDYFSGHNNLSGAQLNFFYDTYYLGVIVPETNSGNEFAGVTGIKLNFK
jgi:hypothetical protein